MPTPVFTIKADGKDVTKNLAGILTTMTITDGEGLESDTMQLVIDDRDGKIEAPRKGAVLNPIGGFEGNTRDFGLFTVDSVTYEGWPQRITVEAKAVAAKSLAKQREPKSYPPKKFKTYGDIFNDIAGHIGLTLRMDASLKSIPNPFEAQAEEDGLHFLTRIGEKINAAVSVKAGNLVVVVKGSGNSASGAQLDHVPIKPGPGGNMTSYSVSEKDEPKYSQVESSYYDRKKNQRKTTVVMTSLDGPKHVIRAPYSDEAEAKRAAGAKAKDLVRAQADATFEIEGNPFLQAEAHVMVSGVRDPVNGLWRVKSVTHNFSSSAPYTCSVQCEKPSKG